jgi:hypothetical protein
VTRGKPCVADFLISPEFVSNVSSADVFLVKTYAPTADSQRCEAGANSSADTSNTLSSRRPCAWKACGVPQNVMRKGESGHPNAMF